MSYARRVRIAGGLMAAILVAGTVGAQVAPEKSSPLAAKEFRHPQLHIDNRVQRVEEQPASVRGPLLDKLADLSVSSPAAYLDPRTGRFATLMPSLPLLPGTGEGNSVTWSQLGADVPVSARDWEGPAQEALLRYLSDRSAALGIDVAELGTARVAVHDDGAIVQLHAPRVVNGVPVRESFLTAVINHGNLVLFGAHNWGTVRVSSAPTVAAPQATQALNNYLQASKAESFRRKATLAFVPLSTGPLESLGALDRGLEFRLVWVLSPQFAGSQMGTYEALVDAHSGELLAFSDTDQYQSVRRVQGGVYPVSNDLVPPDGTEQPGWPFPYADVTTSSGTFFTDTGGNVPVCATGPISSTLNGRYILMNDTCGAVNQSAAGDIDFGVSGGTDCTVPAGSSGGNTHATRTGFYELNKIKEQGRGQLPNNAWLQQQLLANMNIIATCNAGWNGVSVRFFRSGGGCNNTGEIAAIFDHEWGHGMDNNDVNGAIASPGEGIADIYMALRLKESCVGRNFRTTNCGGYGNPCLSCTGVRDIDWNERALQQPTTITWIDANCGAAAQNGPCGGSVHCEGAVYAEALWDLFNRDLPAAGFSSDTALEIATRTTYIGSGPSGPVFQCVQGSGGCPASGAYLNFLAADDDNGDITTGTPHFQYIRDAFNRHGIACATPATFNSGCANAPNTAPVVTATAEDKAVRLSWTTVPGGVKYRVFRTEGVFGCNFGKVLLGETFGTTWSDAGLQNGRPYSYSVAAVGLANTCLGPLSACTNVTPVAGSNLTLDAAATVVATTGDADPYLDNCEQANISFNVTNTSGTTQTNVRVAAVQPLSHPGMQIVNTGTPTPSLAPCGNVAKTFAIRAVDMTTDQTVRLRVDVTSDQMFPAVRSQIVEFAGTESDNQAFASRTFDFELGAEGWSRVAGTFNRTNAAPGGAGGAGFYWQSSANLDNQCDEVQSPIMTLSATSTLSLQNNYDIEPLSGTWYDRANVGRITPAGVRTVVSPDGGRPYEASGINGPCTLNNQGGWAGPNTTWGPSSFSAAALGSASVAGQPLRLNIRYGTDGAATGVGFRFDQVTVTNVTLQVPDVQTNQCVGGNTAPNAVADISNAPTFGPVTIPVLANDTEPQGQCMRVAAVTAPANGTAIINSVGCPNTDTVTYIPSFSCGNPCNDSFQYSVSDQNGGLSTATVTINQVPVELQNFKVE